MTRDANARVAGAAFLVYVGAGIATMSGAVHGCPTKKNERKRAGLPA